MKNLTIKIGNQTFAQLKKFAKECKQAPEALVADMVTTSLAVHALISLIDDVPHGAKNGKPRVS